MFYNGYFLEVIGYFRSVWFMASACATAPTQVACVSVNIVFEYYWFDHTGHIKLTYDQHPTSPESLT